jgi:MoaA/NifB/PqqE/SkfB family radical SAM enzyme
LSLPFPSGDCVALLRDENVHLRSAFGRMLAERLATANAHDLSAALWELSGTDASEALPAVMPYLADRNPRVATFALTAVRSLHPLAGLRARPGARDIRPASATFMEEWLAPREHFTSGLRAALAGTGDRHRLASALAELDGERELIEGTLHQEGHGELAASYVKRNDARLKRRAPIQIIVALTYRCNRKCPYCYAYESQAEYDDDIDLESAVASLDWAKRQGAELVSFTGGEPTCHPRFAELVCEVERRGLRLYLNTNGLFGPAVLRALRSPCVLNVGFHVSERRLHRKGELDVILENASSLRAAGVDVFFRHTLWRAGFDDVDWLLTTSSRLGIRHLNLALGFPGRSATNRYLPAERFEDVKPLFFRTLELAASRGVRVRTSKPVPLCLFTRAEYARFQRHHEMASICSVHERGGVHNLVVNPDLSTYTCVGLPFRGPRLTATDRYADHEEACGNRIRRALSVVQRGCHGCSLHGLGVCQGSCLGHCNEAEPPTGQGAAAE